MVGSGAGYLTRGWGRGAVFNQLGIKQATQRNAGANNNNSYNNNSLRGHDDVPQPGVRLATIARANCIINELRKRLLSSCDRCEADSAPRCQRLQFPKQERPRGMRAGGAACDVRRNMAAPFKKK